MNAIYFVLIVLALLVSPIFLNAQAGLEFNKSSRIKETPANKELLESNLTEVKPGMILLANLGKSAAIQPKIELVASKRFDSSDKKKYNFFAESKLFLGSHDNKDRRSLFVDENANFSFFNTIAWKPFKKESLKKATTFYLNFSYQGKTFTITDSTETNPGIFNLNLGMDLVLFENFAFYGSYNFLQILHDSEGFQKLYSTGLREQYRFYKLGFKAVLDFLDKDQGTLGLNIGFVINNKETKAFHQSNDAVIPILELKFSTNINK